MTSGKKHLLIAAVAAILLACGGISYAWFSQRAAMSTLMNILPPDSISIIPIGEDGQAMTMLDLDFKEGIDEKTEENGEVTITIRRPVCIESTSPVHQLEVVHTTNLNKLEFKIYPATKNQDNSLTYDTGVSLPGEYKNETALNPGLAEAENLNNYKDGNIVEAHAYPLYWLAGNSGDLRYVADKDKGIIVRGVTSDRSKEFDPAKQVEKTYYSTYYYLEISWQENSKETDLFYIMAQNIAVEVKEEGGVSTP